MHQWTVRRTCGPAEGPLWWWHRLAGALVLATVVMLVQPAGGTGAAAGRRLEILPAPGTADKQWIALDSLLRMTLDDQSDPSGAVRELRAEFFKLRAAYLTRSPAEFNAASRGPVSGPRAGPRTATRALSHGVS